MFKIYLTYQNNLLVPYNSYIIKFRFSRFVVLRWPPHLPTLLWSRFPIYFDTFYFVLYPWQNKVTMFHAVFNSRILEWFYISLLSVEWNLNFLILYYDLNLKVFNNITKKLLNVSSSFFSSLTIGSFSRSEIFLLKSDFSENRRLTDFQCFLLQWPIQTCFGTVWKE